MSRSKSTAAELKLQHEINQYSKRMAGRSSAADLQYPDEVAACLGKESRISKVDIKAQPKTEDVLRASWLKGAQSNFMYHEDDKPERIDGSMQGKGGMFKAKKKASPIKIEATNDEEPLLSRLFGSRRSGRKGGKKTDDEKSPIETRTSMYSVGKHLKKEEVKVKSEAMINVEISGSKVPAAPRCGHSFELQEYEEEPGSRSSSCMSQAKDDDVKPSLKIRPVNSLKEGKNESSRNKTDASPENEFMRRFRKISESSEKRSSLGQRRSSGEIVYQSKQNRSPEIGLRCGSEKLSNSFGDSEADSQTVQFRILPGNDNGDTSGSESSLILDSLSIKQATLGGNDEKSEIQVPDNYDDKDVEVTEIIDDNANVTKVPVAKLKVPLRETKTEVVADKPDVGLKNVKLQSGKPSNRRNSAEVVQLNKAKGKSSVPESELFKVFAKLSQKQDTDSNNDKENFVEDSLMSLDGQDLPESPKLNVTLNKESSNQLAKAGSTNDAAMNRPRSRTLPELTPVVLQTQNETINETSVAVKRSNSDKKSALTKQDSVSSDASSEPPSTPPWLAIAQQRREQREKREKNVFGDQNVSFVIEVNMLISLFSVL